MTNSLSPMILQRFNKNVVQKLKSRGVPNGDFIYDSEKIDIEQCIVKIEVDLPGMPTRIISVAKQYKTIEKIFAAPMKNNYVLGISSTPSDARAKYLAIQIMYLATKYWYERSKKVKQPPLWHSVYGGYKDKVRDEIADNPSMLIISNINELSTPIKIEKVRDLLEMYSDIPRIVVLGGSDPFTFFGTKLYYPLTAGFLLGPSNRVRE